MRFKPRVYFLICSFVFGFNKSNGNPHNKSASVPKSTQQDIMDADWDTMFNETKAIENGIDLIIPVLMEYFEAQFQQSKGLDILFDSAVCGLDDNKNSSLSWLESKITTCASPFFKLREIIPEQLMWSEATVEEGGSAEQQTSDSTHQEESWNSFSEKNTAHKSPNSTDKNESIKDPYEEKNRLVAFFLAVDSDPGSRELEAAVTAAAAAFPAIWVVKGDGPRFSRFTAQYGVKSFPRLLLFRAGRLVAKLGGGGGGAGAGSDGGGAGGAWAAGGPGRRRRAHGGGGEPRRRRRGPAAVVAFFAQHTGLMPVAVPLPLLPLPPEPKPFDSLLLASTLYILVNIGIYVRKRYFLPAARI